MQIRLKDSRRDVEAKRAQSYSASTCNQLIVNQRTCGRPQRCAAARGRAKEANGKSVGNVAAPGRQPVGGHAQAGGQEGYVEHVATVNLLDFGQQVKQERAHAAGVQLARHLRSNLKPCVIQQSTSTQNGRVPVPLAFSSRATCNQKRSNCWQTLHYATNNVKSKRQGARAAGPQLARRLHVQTFDLLTNVQLTT